MPRGDGRLSHDLDPQRPGPQDACGVFGVWAPGEEVAKLSYFGLYAGSWAVGGGVGNFVGAYLTTQPLTATAWLVFGAVGVLGSAAFSAVFLTGRTKPLADHAAA